MRVMLVDDECPCLEELEYLLTGYSDIVVIGTFVNPLDALSAMRSSCPTRCFWTSVCRISAESSWRR